MAFSWLRLQRKAKANARNTKQYLSTSGVKPNVETLEDRMTPAGSVFQFHIAQPSGPPTFTFGGTNLITVAPTTGTSQLTVTVDRTGDTTGAGSVDFATVDETATSNVNYTPTTGTLNFAAGQTSATFTVDILSVPPPQDGSLTGPLSFGLGLSNASTGDSINQTAAAAGVTIRDSNGTQNQRYINDVFFQLLNRPADPGALQFFGGELDAGTAKGIVLLQIESNVNADGRNEYNDNQINQLYQTFLGRNADLGGLNAFGAQLTAGIGLQVIQAEIMSSDEYFINAGGTNAGFVEQMYRDLVNRNPDAGGETFYLNMLSNPSTVGERQNVLNNFIGQVEPIQSQVTSFYASLLNRMPDAGGLSFYTGELQGGTPLQTVVNQFLGNTNEYFNGC